jgi:hypothetical protein
MSDVLRNPEAKVGTGAAFNAIVAVLNDYFDGLYFSDTTILRRVFHPGAIYACPTGGTLLQLQMDAYFDLVDKRPAPAGLGQQRQDRIVSIEFAGPVLALARVECAIAPKRFQDLLTLVHLDGRWQIMSKVFHFEVVE